jgi:hypothetical protein
MVCFNFSFCNPDDQINPSQIIKCEMNKEDHIELFVIEESVIVEGVHKIFKPLWDVEFFTCDNYIYGSRDDIEEHAGLDYGSFSLPLSTEKVDD